jgi:anaerobic selenocysteine-containing dehydrogenase
MTAIVKRPGFNVPEAVAKKAGIKPGDLVEFTARRGSITITTFQVDEERFPLYTPAKAESNAIAKGRAAYKRGDYVTLNQLHNELDTAHRASKKSLQKFPDKDAAASCRLWMDSKATRSAATLKRSSPDGAGESATTVVNAIERRTSATY